MDRDIYISNEDLIRRRDQNAWKDCSTPLSRYLRTDRPIALLFRQIATPSFEVWSFVRKARRFGLEPVILEHVNDRFSVHNSYKRSLAVMPIALGKNCYNEIVWRRQKLAKLDSLEGCKLKSIKLASGESLVSYHHRKLYGAFGARAPRLVDLKEIVPSVAFGAQGYYHDLLNLLHGNVVLFEDFVVDPQTADFFTRVVLPAYEGSLMKMSGRPQIARLTFGGRSASPFWNYYPPSVSDSTMAAAQGGYHAANCI